ncbi:MAG: NAD-dependent epimerase/dehydratase family protein [Thermoleophilia bacterium]
MRIFVAGATGALGRQLVPALAAAGHDVTGTTRRPERIAAIEALGARGAVMDALDPDAVGAAVAAAEPEVVVHQLTALSGSLDLRRFERSFAATNRLRIEGTDHLLAAARAAGAGRFVAQSYAGWPFARTGRGVNAEDAPFDPHPAAAMRTTLAALRHLEDAVTGADGIEGIVLRYGGFYGPGTSMAAGAEHLEALRARKFPLVGDGGGIAAFVHVADAAAATVAAIERGAPGIYNVVDDDHRRAAEWMPDAAAALGARPPRRVPRWLARLLAGEAAVAIMTRAPGASNDKARRDLGWTPRNRSLAAAIRAGRV